MLVQVQEREREIEREREREREREGERERERECECSASCLSFRDWHSTHKHTKAALPAWKLNWQRYMTLNQVKELGELSPAHLLQELASSDVALHSTAHTADEERSLAQVIAL